MNIKNAIDFRTAKIVAPPIVEFKKQIANFVKADGVIDLSQAVPSYPMPQEMKNYISNNFSEDLSYYTTDQGLIELREEICKLHGPSLVNTEEILVTAGASQGAFSVFTSLFKTGDKVALPVPYYFNYDMALRMLGVEPVYYFLDEADGYKLIFDKLDKKIFKTCKAVIVVNPNNPTGAEYDVKELKKLYNECVNNSVTLISDEAYGFFSTLGYPGSSMLNIAGSMDGLVIINTFSKTFSLTGFRIGYVLARKQIIDEVIKVQDTLIICAPRVSQMMVLYGLKNCLQWLKQKTDFVRSNAEQFSKLFNSKHEKFKLSSCTGFFAYIKHPYENKTALQVSMQLAKEAKILVLPGSIFGPSQERYLRLAFGNISDPKKLSEVVDRL